MRIDCPFSCRKLDAPDVLARFDTVNTDLSRFSTAWIAYPNYAEASFLFTMLNADHVPFLADVIDSRDTGAGACYVDGPGLAGEWASRTVHPPNANGELVRHPVIDAASHVVAKITENAVKVYFDSYRRTSDCFATSYLHEAK